MEDQFEDFYLKPSMTYYLQRFRKLTCKHLSTPRYHFIDFWKFNLSLENVTLCIVPDWKLYCTGGTRGDGKAVIEINLQRDFALTSQAPMLNGRVKHSSIFFQGFIYIIGGYFLGDVLKTCERLHLNTGAWESIQDLPSEMHSSPLAIHEERHLLFTLGGITKMNRSHNFTMSVRHIQQLNLLTLSWKTLTIFLPVIPVTVTFRIYDDFYLISDMLYRFIPETETIEPIEKPCKLLLTCESKFKWNREASFITLIKRS